jgi:hypothetical protein
MVERAMSGIHSGWGLPALCLLAFAASPAARAEPRADMRLAGDWQLDTRASDNFDELLGKRAEALRLKRNARHGGMRGGGPGGPDGGDAGVDAHGVPMLTNEPPPESRDELRERLGETYRPPEHLQIRADDDEVRMLGDTAPERIYNLQETVTRMDLSGTASLRSSWTGNGLQVESRYTNRSHSTQRFVVDRSGSVLNVSLELTEPIGGKLQVHSVYHRVSASAATAPGTAGGASPAPPAP